MGHPPVKWSSLLKLTFPGCEANAEGQDIHRDSTWEIVIAEFQAEAEPLPPPSGTAAEVRSVAIGVGTNW